MNARPQHRAGNYRHGHKPANRPASPEYIAWRGMIQRCHNPNVPHYANYGGRGIRVCDRWRESFTNFLADMGFRPECCTSIERIDNTANYEPINCRWATDKEQANNRRSSRYLTYRGRTQTMAKWSAEVGLKLSTVHQRLKMGWSVERALSEPRRGQP